MNTFLIFLKLNRNQAKATYFFIVQTRPTLYFRQIKIIIIIIIIIITIIIIVIILILYINIFLLFIFL